MNIKNTGLNMNSLFSSLNTSGSSNFAFTDYAAIKNGSYGKLLKSYYAEKSAEDKKTAKTAAEEAVAKKTETPKLLDSDNAKQVTEKEEPKKKVDVLTTLLSDYQKPYTKDAAYDNTTQTGGMINTSV